MPTSKMPTWFITGASSGFGLAFAKYALDRGYSVVATARSVNKLEELAAQAPDRVLTHKLDVTVVDDAEQAIAAQVGADSAAAVKGHAEQLLKDLTNWEKVAVETQVSADS